MTSPRAVREAAERPSMATERRLLGPDRALAAGGERREVHALGEAARDEHGILHPLERGEGGMRIGRLRVVDEPNRADGPYDRTSMRQRAEGKERGPDGLGREPERQRGRGGGGR